jgi:alpha-N-arabinofuranosidase
MHRRGPFVLLALVFAVSLFAQSAATPPAKVTAVVDASRTGEPITKYMYGTFIEHLGDLINRGLWAEMLDDRKLYFSVDSKPLPPIPPAIRPDSYR